MHSEPLSAAAGQAPGLPITLPFEAVANHPAFRHLSSVAKVAVDLRYASANNFVGRNLYAPMDCSWLHADAAAALERAAAWLQEHAPTKQLLVLDALRPQRIQQTLWDTLAGTGLQSYLAEPKRGSIHSFGMALDVTLTAQPLEGAASRNTTELDMGTGFDEMNDASHPELEANMLASGRLTPHHVANRQTLRSAMQHGGFQGISSEWWHFDCGDRALVRSTYPRVV